MTQRIETDRQIVRVRMARQGVGIVDEDGVKRTRPAHGVVNLVRFVNEPDRGFVRLELTFPALGKTPSMDHEDQVGPETLDARTQVRIVPQRDFVLESELLRGVTQSSSKHITTG